jgi:hypothetical protein
MKEIIFGLLVPWMSVAVLPSGASARDASYVTLSFGTQLNTCLSAGLIWSEFAQAMIQSDRSRLWPDELSSVRGGQGLTEGARIDVTYHTRWWGFTYGYVLSDVVVDQGFVYTADGNHPFEGGARIDIQSLDAETRQLSWYGEYKVAAEDRRRQEFFKDFSERFFVALESRVRAMEQSEKCGGS